MDKTNNDGGVTQADRLLVADILDEVSDLLDHNGIGQCADLIRDGEYDEHETVCIAARHRQQAIAQHEGDEKPTQEGVEQAAWDWLDQTVSSICDEHPSDIAYSADQMIDAFAAGARLSALQSERDAAVAEVGRLREALVAADDAIREMFRYYDGGETRGSYDGKPERNQLRRAGYATRAELNEQPGGEDTSHAE